MEHKKRQEKYSKYFTWLKKPICISGIIYLLFYLWFIILTYVESFLISLSKIFFNLKININELIAFKTEYFLSFFIAIILVTIFYNKASKDSLMKVDILKISLYLSLIELLQVKVNENFIIPFQDWTMINTILSDLFIIIKNFIIFAAITYVSNKIAYKLKDINFTKIFRKISYQVCIIIFIFILMILDIIRRRYL